MELTRNILLRLSGNRWLKDRVPRLKFVRRAVRRFMPGDTIEAALDAAAGFERDGIPAVFTRLGEHITHKEQAQHTRDHYLDVVDKIAERELTAEISVKPTQLGLELALDDTLEYCREIACKAGNILGNDFFLDMEGSGYLLRTLELYTRLKQEFDNTGLCIQAYLHRADSDLEDLFTLDATLRLVKGAYKEPDELAIQSKKLVDENFLSLARKMLHRTKNHGTRMIYATHDENLIARIIEESKKIYLPKSELEFQMLYGIQTQLQKQLVHDGYKVRVLIAYGESWYPWYMRRLAERPANVWFVLKNIFKQ